LITYRLSVFRASPFIATFPLFPVACVYPSASFFPPSRAVSGRLATVCQPLHACPPSLPLTSRRSPNRPSQPYIATPPPKMQGPLPRTPHVHTPVHPLLPHSPAHARSVQRRAPLPSATCFAFYDLHSPTLHTLSSFCVSSVFPVDAAISLHPFARLNSFPQPPACISPATVPAFHPFMLSTWRSPRLAGVAVQILRVTSPSRLARNWSPLDSESTEDGTRRQEGLSAARYRGERTAARVRGRVVFLDLGRAGHSECTTPRPAGA
jgi:hypothetical protein